MTALVFMDTETTGLSLDDDIWEFAAIRREADGTESETHLFLRHDTRKCAQLPERFRLDHEKRFPASHTSEWHPAALAPWEAALLIAQLFEDRPHVVGAVPNFDTERVAKLLAAHDQPAAWHYHLIDAENLVVGYLAGQGKPVLPPWNSDDLNAALGLDPVAEDERHAAMGDARWAMRMYDAVMGGAS